MKSLLALILVFTLGTALLNSCSGSSMSDAAVEPTQVAYSPDELFARSQERMANIQSGAFSATTDVTHLGTSLTIRQEGLIESPDRSYVKTTGVAGIQSNEVLTDHGKFCIRIGNAQGWSEFKDPNPQFGFLSRLQDYQAAPKGLTALADTTQAGVRVHRITGTLDADDATALLPPGLGVSYSNMVADYYIGIEDPILWRTDVSFEMQVPNTPLPARAKATYTFSRIDEKITLPTHVPQTCDERRL